MPLAEANGNLNDQKSLFFSKPLAEANGS